MTKFINNKSIAMTWFITYIVVFMLPTTILSVAYIKINSMIESEVRVSNEAIFNHLSDNLKKTTTDINLLSMELAHNEDIQKLASFSGEITSQKQYELITTVNSLKNYRIFNEKILEFYIYFPKIKTILTSSSVTDPSTFFYGHYGLKNNIEPWLTSLNQSYVQSKYFPSREDNNLIYARSLFLNSKTGAPDANIFIIIDKKILDLDVNNTSFLRNGAAFITADDGQVLYYIGDEKYKNFISELTEADDKHKLKAFTEKKIENTVVTIAKQHLPSADWDYVNVIPSSAFWASIRYARIFSYALFALSLSLGLFLAFFMTKRNYKPLNKLMTSLSPYNKSGANIIKDEYKTISTIIEEMLTETQKFKSIVCDQNEIIKLNILEQLLRVDDFEVFSIDFEKYDIVFKSDYFAVLALYIYKSPAEIEDFADSQKTRKLINLLACSLLEKFAQEIGLVYVTTINGTPIVLINIHEDKIDTWKKSLKDAEADIQNIVSEYMHASATITVSSLHKSIPEISLAYQQAVSPIYFQHDVQDGLFFYEDFATEVSLHNDFITLPQVYKLRSFLNYGDSDSAMGLIDKMIEGIISINKNKLMQKTMFNNMSAIILMIINEYDLNIDNNLINEVLFFSDSHQNISGFRKKIKSIINLICEQNSVDQPFYIKEKICNYIINNYHDPNLSLTTISEYMNLNPAYISREFKKQFGENLNDYISKVRIDHAKELLLEKKLTISEISKAVGYDNPRTFTRNFQKSEGITPSAFTKKK